MPSQKIDIRSVKTKRAIRNSFAKLLSEIPFDKITVKQIAALSEVNRKTFYRYYRSVSQVYEEIEDDVIAAFDDFLNNTDLIEALKQPESILENLNLILDEERELYRYLMHAGENAGFLSKVNRAIKKKAKQIVTVQRGFEEHDADIVLEYAITGMISVYRSWYVSERRESLSEISDIIGIMYTRGIAGLLAENKLKRLADS